MTLVLCHVVLCAFGYKERERVNWENPSFRDYVQRAFDQCETEEHKDITENHLKKMLTIAFKQGSAWGINWDKEPLPK